MSLALTGVEALAAFAGLLVALVLGLVYGLVPLILWTRHRQSPDPQIAPREPDMRPSPAEEFNHEVGPILSDLGFGEVQRWAMQGFVSNIVTDVCTMADRRRRVLAIASVTHVRRQGAFRIHARTVEFASRTEDGRAIVTTNSTLPYMFKEMGPRRLFQFPALSDLALLLRAHEALAARHLGDAPLIQPPEVKAFPHRLHETIRQSLDWQESEGWIRKTKSGNYRLTLKGAFIQTWAALPPFKNILRKRRLAESKRLLAELGLEGGARPS
ncbi:MAG: hypothetical protein K8T20_07750 [Planctomycetes bacterium]|nr:hypothetical protein [Planctomycetota bacterium]